MDKDARDREINSIRTSRKLEMQKSGVDTCSVFKSNSKNEKLNRNSSEGEDWSSDWTWETCSSSDEEGVDFVKKGDGSYSYSLPK